ncbi:MAG: M24 family metallopeptidase [Clostridiaceae bacterium]
MNSFRVNKVLEEMKKLDVDKLLISDPASIFYLTGKWIHPGERMLVLCISLKGKHKLFINELFPVSEDLGIDKVWFNDIDDEVSMLAKYIGKNECIGIDKNWPCKFLLRLMDFLGKDTRFVNGSNLVDKIRMYKDEEEKMFMRKASQLNDMAVDKLINSVDKNLSEKEMSKILLSIYEDLGSEGFSFEPIIAFGKNTADPHHETDKSYVSEGDSVILDIGCMYKSYCSDMTRTVFYKNVSDKYKEIYNIVLEANKRGIAAVKPGVKFSDIDKAARSYIEEKGFSKYFTHRTGHSIGIDVHDLGDVSSANNEIVQPGMIFSIEPGIYLQGDIGVRIEDLVLVTEDGCEVLNKYSKELKVI